jgi:CheY-like chemotaxis protein
MRILAVDDKPINNKVIELDVEEYLEAKGVQEYYFIERSSGLEAISVIQEDSIDVVFIDIMMPVMDGLEVVKQIREHGDNIKQPVIVMVTALNDENMKKRSKEVGADSFIFKPYCNQEISDVMDFCFSEFEKSLNSEDNFEDDFLDFDEFEDFDALEDSDDKVINTQKEMMDDFNKSHKQVSAEEFLEDHIGLSYIVDELNEVQTDIEECIDILYEGNIDSKIDDVISTLNQYSRFLNEFIEFQEPSMALTLLTRILETTDFDLIDDSHNHLISEYIKGILTDLIQWKEHVFVLQDAVDVFYINASLLSSCIQLETILKKSTTKA